MRFDSPHGLTRIWLCHTQTVDLTRHSSALIGLGTINALASVEKNQRTEKSPTRYRIERTHSTGLLKLPSLFLNYEVICYREYSRHRIGLNTGHILVRLS